MKHLRIFSTLIFVLIISACTNSIPDYFTNPSCDPPCFMGITPGLTDALETNKLLLSSPMVKANSIYGSGMIKRNWYPVSYSYDWEFTNGGEGAIWLTGESKAVYIDVIDPRISINQFSKTYGEPSTLLIVPYRGYKTHVYLVYPELGVILDVNKRISRNNDLTIRAIDQIKKITFVDKTLLNTIIHFFVFGNIYEESPKNNIDPIIQTWAGFGKYTTINFWN